MKAPALWIAAGFASGIVLCAKWPLEPSVWLIAASTLILAAAILARALQTKDLSGAPWSAWIAAILGWCALGGAAAGIERLAVPPSSVARMIASGRLDTTVSLRWVGRLREDGLALPWGGRYEIALESVTAQGLDVPVSGGLRVNYFRNPRTEESLPVLRAGDRVEVLVRARLPRNFLDLGAVNIREILAGQGVDIVGTLRSTELLHKIDTPPLTLAHRLALIRGNLLSRLDATFADKPEQAAVLRAMLLGDRQFVDSDVAMDFQKTAAFHVLVVAGLHVGALCAFLLWIGQRLRFSPWLTMLLTLSALAFYTGVVQDRPPVLRAALMATLYLCARPLFRRVDLINTVALAALALLLWHPAALADESFELSFLAAGSIAGLALPWIDRTAAPYVAALRHLSDVTRDASFAPKIAQFRLDLRAASAWLAVRLPSRIESWSGPVVTAPARVGLRLWELFVLSFVLQWAMLPLLASAFHRVSLSGPLSNIPAALLTGLIVPFGFLMLGATFLGQRVAAPFAWLLGGLVRLLVGTVHWFASVPRFSYRIPQPPMWLLLACLAVLAVLCAFARAKVTVGGRRQRRSPKVHGKEGSNREMRMGEWTTAGILAVLTLGAATHPFAPIFEKGKLEVTVLDVGQGDSIFAAFPDGRTMLVDGGGELDERTVAGYRVSRDIGEDVVAPYLWTRGIKRLDVVALTHAHHDHLGGLRSVLQDFRVGQLWVGVDAETPAFNGLLAEAKHLGVPVVHQRESDRHEFGGTEADVLWPQEATPGPTVSNDESLVMRLSDGEKSILLPGDIEQKTERTLAGSSRLKSDFLKVPHHGSKTSSTKEFVAAVAPRVAVISVGEGNSFGHPNARVVERYEKRGVRLLQTNRDGAVTALTDGKSLTITTYRELHPPD